MTKEININNKWDNPYRNQTMIDGYMTKMMRELTVLHPELSPKELNDMLMEYSLQCYKPKIIDVNITGNNKTDRMPVDVFDKIMVENHPIISGSGTFYYRQDQVENDRAKMLEAFAINRKKAKKEMFAHINDKDQSIKNSFDTQQKTW